MNTNNNEDLEQFFIYKHDNINYVMPKCHEICHQNFGLFEYNLLNYCRSTINGNIFLDVGAHTGSYSLFLSNNFNKVIAFEPQKRTYYGLCGSIALNRCKNINAYNYGLGSIEQMPSQDLFIISKDGGGSTVIEQSNYIKKETIKMITLDIFLKDNSINDKIDFIKVDIEGNELEFFKGAEQTILMNQPTILFECNIRNKLLFDWLMDRNYKIESTMYDNMFFARSKL